MIRVTKGQPASHPSHKDLFTFLCSEMISEEIPLQENHTFIEVNLLNVVCVFPLLVLVGFEAHLC